MFLKFFKKFNSSVFIKPIKKKQLAVLKAPHRDKTSRHLVYFARYEILLSINCDEGIKYFTQAQLFTFLKEISALLRKIDSSICYQKYVKLNFLISFKGLLDT
jgi:hypothetical protein